MNDPREAGRAAAQLVEAAALFQATVADLARGGREQLVAARALLDDTRAQVEQAQARLAALDRQGQALVGAYRDSVQGVRHEFAAWAAQAGGAHAKALAETFGEGLAGKLRPLEQQLHGAGWQAQQAARRLERDWAWLVGTTCAAVAAAVLALVVGLPRWLDTEQVRRERDAWAARAQQLETELASAKAEAVVLRSAAGRAPGRAGGERRP